MVTPVLGKIEWLFCACRTLAEVVGNREGDEDSLDVSLSNVDLENSGRGKRRKESIDYSVFLGNDGVSERNLEEYVNRVSEMAQKREAGMMAYNKEVNNCFVTFMEILFSFI